VPSQVRFPVTFGVQSRSVLSHVRCPVKFGVRSRSVSNHIQCPISSCFLHCSNFATAARTEDKQPNCRCLVRLLRTQQAVSIAIQTGPHCCAPWRCSVAQVVLDFQNVWPFQGTRVIVFCTAVWTARHCGSVAGTLLARCWHVTGTLLARHWHVAGTLLARHWHVAGTLLARCSQTGS